MGIHERKERERAEMRRLILDAATSMFLEDGYEKTSIRRIAQKIEYSPGTIYLYFKDKTEIFYAIHEAGFELFLKKLQKSLALEDPVERLDRMGHLYLEFAFEHPEYYDLMFIMRAPLADFEKPEDWRQGHRSFDFLRDTVRQCIDAKKIQAEDPDSTAVLIWSFVHGLSSLAIRERLSMFADREHKKLRTKALDLFMDRLRTQPKAGRRKK